MFQRSLLLTLLLLLVIPEVTYARLLCRSDPMVELSNGVRLFISASINTDQSNITQINMELHVPVGVTAKNIVYFPDWTKSVERFTIIADQRPDQYYVNTTVRARSGTAAVTAQTVVIDRGRSAYQSSSLTGQTSTTQFSISRSR